MDDWNSLKLKMEVALQAGNLEQALLHLKAMIISESSPPEARDILANHTIQGIPTFHYLARFCYREVDAPFLNRLFDIFTEEVGYDVNKTTDKCMVSKRSSHGFTALMASVVHGSLIQIECLFQHGARLDIRDNQGFSLCHWAILKGNLKCLEKLVQFGGPAVLATSPIEISGEGEVLPVLHMAVDDGRLEIVRYLLSISEEHGVDVNQEAIYENISMDKQILYIYKPHAFTGRCNRRFTPLGRALYIANAPIIEALWNHPGARPSRFKELESFVKFGETEKALPLLKYISDEELPADKIQDRWTCIHQLTFLDNSFAEFTNQILAYAGLGSGPKSVDIFYWASFMDNFGKSCTKVTLLHLACLYKRMDIIKVLVEEAGADVNRKSEAEVEVTPLHILLRLKNWEGAKYMIEQGADLNIRGSFGSRDEFMRTRLIRRNLTIGNLEPEFSFNSVEILLRMGCRESLLNQMLARPGIVWHGANEFHTALDGGNPSFILKVLKRNAKVISREELTWVTTWKLNTIGVPLKMPSLIWLLKDLIERKRELNRLSLKKLANLIKHLVNLGYDLTIWGEPPLLSISIEKEPLIFYILKFDLAYGTSNVLLKTFLQFEQLQLNIDIRRGFRFNPVTYLLEEWKNGCLNRGTSMCTDRIDSQQPILEAINLLLSRALDVSGMVIGADFQYHRDSKIIFKMLYRAGAKISEEFFTSTRVCQYNSRGADAIAKEIQELKEWKEEFDREARLSLHRICSLRVRKMVRCIGDLKMLNNLPESLKADVLGTNL